MGALRLQLPVTMILARRPAEELIAEIDRGKSGIMRIKEMLCSIDAEAAEASIAADETRIKALIRSTVGFERVNQRVQQSMVAWVAAMLRRHIDRLMQTDSAVASAIVPLRRFSCVLTPCRARDGGCVVSEIAFEMEEQQSIGSCWTPR